MANKSDMESISDQSIREYLTVLVHNAMLKDSANAKSVDGSLESSIESAFGDLLDNRSLKNAPNITTANPQQQQAC